WAWRWAGKAPRRPFDLARGPLCRFVLLRLGGGGRRLLVNLHHAVCDGTSVGVLLREIAILYQGALLPELPIQYADYAAWQRQWLQGRVLPEHRPSGRGRRPGAPAALDLPLDRPRPVVQGFRGGLVS